MQIKMIWAQGPSGEIGIKGDLPWRLPGDLARFKAATAGHAVLMGRSTWDSLPRKPLPGRDNLVLSRSTQAFAGATGFQNLDDALAYASERHDVLWVIGGAAVYEECLPRCSGVLVTHVPRRVEGADTFAPRIPLNWPHLLLEEFETDDFVCRVVGYTNPGRCLDSRQLWGLRK